MFFFLGSIVMVNLTLVFQIAAKIGGDAGPPMNNNTASDGFAFTAQKRQLEDAGTGDCASQGAVSLIYRGSGCASFVALVKSVGQMNNYEC